VFFIGERVDYPEARGCSREGFEPCLCVGPHDGAVHPPLEIASDVRDRFALAEYSRAAARSLPPSSRTAIWKVERAQRRFLEQESDVLAGERLSCGIPAACAALSSAASRKQACNSSASGRLSRGISSARLASVAVCSF
jgi:hypothetical protein